MNTQQASDCLNQMGIEVWISQCALPGARQSIDCQYYCLRRPETNETVATLLLQTVPTLPQQQQKVRNLMDNIGFALGLQAELIADSLKQPEGILVILGLSLAQKILQTDQPFAELQQLCQQKASTPPIIVSYHPLELLQQPQLKPKLWQDLQLLRDQVVHPSVFPAKGGVDFLERK